MTGQVRSIALGVAVGAATVLPGFLVGALSLQIRDDLDAGLGVVAAGVTVFFSAGALSAGPLGRVTERVGPLTTMRAATLLTALALFAIAAFAGSLAVLFGLLIVAGFANGAAQPAINLFMTREVRTARQGLAFGIKQSAIPAAIALSGLALPLLALPLGWRATTAVCGGLVACVALLTARRRRLAAAPPPRTQAPPRLDRSLVLLGVGAALAAFGPSALSAGLVATAVEAGISEGGAGIVLAAGSVASFAMRIWLGARADRRADYGFSVIALLLGGGALGFALIGTGAQAGVLAGALVAFTLGWGWPGLYNLAVVRRYSAGPAAATGVTQTGIYAGAAAGPVAFGVLAATAGFSATWLVVAAAAACAALVISLTQSRFEKADSGTDQTGAGAGIRHI